MELANKLLNRLRGRTSAPPSAPPPSPPLGTPLAFDPLDAAYIENPYPIYKALRTREPVHRSPLGLWVVTRYVDVLGALENPLLGNSPAPYAVLNERNRSRYVCADVANNILPFLDAPRHTASRRLIGRTFNGNLRRQALDMESIASEILAEHKGRGEIELLGDFGLPFSVRLTGDLLGVPRDDQSYLKQCSEWFFYLFAPIPSDEVRTQVDKALEDFRQYFAKLIAERKQNPGRDLISELLTAESGGHQLSDTELIDTCMLLFADGVENIDSGLGSAVLSLLSHPEQMKLLRDDPALINSAVNELLRYETPAQFIGRVAQDATSIGGVPIRKNDGVLLMLGAANRDPDQFEEPDRVDIRRHPNPHLVFGKGRHTCIGASFATMQFAVALRVILDQLPNLELASEKQTWVPRLGHRWLAELPLRFDGNRV